MHEPESFMKI